jgi:hypothetical protein
VPDLVLKMQKMGSASYLKVKMYMTHKCQLRPKAYGINLIEERIKCRGMISAIYKK